jgi:XRE family transcriptional regulator, regulator of sulfur utilization
METMDRRGVFAVLASLGALSLASAEAAPSDILSTSKVIKYDALPVRTFPNGGTQRRVISGTLPTGEFIEVHESMLPPGQMPHPPHHHPNTEMLFIQTGDLVYLDNGKPVPTGPGDIVFTASETMHGLKNVGTTPATYIVVSVGKQLPEN